MPSTPHSAGQAHLTTSGELFQQARAKHAAALDRVWDDPNKETWRMADFWAAEGARYTDIPASTTVPLF